MVKRRTAQPFPLGREKAKRTILIEIKKKHTKKKAEISWRKMLPHKGAEDYDFSLRNN